MEHSHDKGESHVRETSLSPQLVLYKIRSAIARLHRPFRCQVRIRGVKLRRHIGPIYTHARTLSPSRIHGAKIMGVHPSEAMMHFSPVSDFPSVSEKISTLWKMFKISPFPHKFWIFIRQNFWWPSFSHRLQIWNFLPMFAISIHFPTLLFHENYCFPLLL